MAKQTKTYKELRERFDEIQKNLTACSERFPWDQKEAYISWLVQSYEYVLNSTRILAAAGARFPAHQTKLCNRFIAHAAEERDHDKLLVKDVASFGRDISSEKTLPIAEAFHKSLYFWIHDKNPLALFGWVLALEGFACLSVPRIYTIAKDTYGAKATIFLKVHSDEDPDHLDKAFGAIEDLNGEDMAVVYHGLDLYGQLYLSMLEDIIVSSAQKTTTTAQPAAEIRA